MRRESLLHCAVYVTVTLHVQPFWQGFGQHGLSEIEKKQDNSSISESNLLNFKETYPNFISITCDKLKIEHDRNNFQIIYLMAIVMPYSTFHGKHGEITIVSQFI